MTLIEKFHAYNEFQQQALELLFSSDKHDKDYFFRALERNSRHETELDKEKLKLSYQQIVEDGWISEEEEFISFKPNDENILTFLTESVKNNRPKWREKLIKNVVKYVGVEESDDILKALDALDRADFVPKELIPYADIDFPIRLKVGMTESALHAVLMTIKPLSPKKGEKILVCGSKGGVPISLTCPYCRQQR
jgi:hypothetical protein